MKEHESPEHGIPDDPLERIRTAAQAIDLPEGQGAPHIRRRGRRRRNTKRLATAGVGAALLGVVAFAATSVDPDDRVDVEVVAAPIDHDPPTFVSADTSWKTWDLPTVIDRLGEPAPIYRRDGDPARVVVLLGESVPCLDPATCVEPNVADPAEIGFLDPAGPFVDWTAIYIPGWNGDFHLGRRAGARVNGVQGRHEFVGAENVEAVVGALARELDVPLDRLVLAGTGGGAVGALHHASTFDDFLAPTTMHLLLDGGVVAGRGGMVPACMTSLWASTWGAHPTEVPPATADTAASIYETVTQRLPHAEFTLVVHDEDLRLGRFFGLSANDCALVTDPIPNARLRAILDTAVETTEALPAWDIVVLAGTRHTVIDASPEDPITARVQEALRPIADG